MRYTEEQETRAYELASAAAVKGLPQVKALEGRGMDGQYDVAVSGSTSHYEVQLYIAERIYCCQCKAHAFGNACKHVGFALMEHDRLYQLSAAGVEEVKLIEEPPFVEPALSEAGYTVRASDSAPLRTTPAFSMLK